MKPFVVAVVVVFALAGSYAMAATHEDAKPAKEPAAGKPVVKAAAETASHDAVKVEPIKDNWDWPEAMRKVTAKFTGTQGVVLHIGDSITYANPYGAWARGGHGQTESDKQILQWMHAGQNNDQDGWYLASFDVPNRNGSYTAVSGMRLDQALAGGHHGLPAMADIIKKYNPQVVIFMLGTNDASQNRSVAEYKADLEKAVKLILDNNTILVLSTLSPMAHKQPLVQQYNDVIVEIAKTHKLPLIDYYGQILSRQPGTAWNGTLLGKDDAHPSAVSGNITAGSEPTPENLSKVGYLLRGWLSVQKMKQVKAEAIDPVTKKGGKPMAESHKNTEHAAH